MTHVRAVFPIAVLLVAACASPRRSPAPRESVTQGAAQSCALPRAESLVEREDRSVTGAPLATCGTAPMTGVYRDGRCATGANDVGVHVVCAQVTEEFLRFTASRGNDLVHPAGSFPGLAPGDRWCLCASRWAEADAVGAAPPVVLEATHERALSLLSREQLEARSLASTPERPALSRGGPAPNL